ncbi:MAG: carbon-nitrogen hydrolase family protein [Anaerolineae bacterium]|nr:carbon-nitrogen hydrolase family protein [Anaerolineae bacterium]
MREVTVAVVQAKPELGSVQQNLAHMSDIIDEISRRQKVDLIIFPELMTTGYEVGVGFTDLAERVPGPSANIIAQRAREFNTHIAFGMVIKEKVESVLYNAAILISNEGEVLGDYRKIHLKGEERMTFRPGFRLPVFETAFGDVGMLIGWDQAFPEAARSLALDGAELLLVLANWEEPHADEWRAYNVARAFENSVFVAASNRVGEEVTLNFFGQSMIVGPRGEPLALVDEPGEGYGVARIDLDLVRRYREEFQIIQSRQPAVYRSLVRKY